MAQQHKPTDAETEAAAKLVGETCGKVIVTWAVRIIVFWILCHLFGVTMAIHWFGH